MEKLNCDLYELSELTESEKKDTEGGTSLASDIGSLVGRALAIAVKFFIILEGGAPIPPVVEPPSIGCGWCGCGGACS